MTSCQTNLLLVHVDLMEWQQNMHHVTRIDAFLYCHLKTPSQIFGCQLTGIVLSYLSTGTLEKNPKNQITLPLLHPSENKDQVTELSGGYANVFIRSEGRNNEMLLPSPQRKEFDATWCFNRNITGGVFVSCLSAWTKTHKIFFVCFNHDDNRIFNLTSAFFLAKHGKSWAVPI